MKKRIFYSWQSDLPNNTNRGFINTALDKAIEKIKSDTTYSIIPFLDRDTMGMAGSPDISLTIFEKINNSSVFVCDVSIVNNSEGNSRPTPNPNVLIELGYAVSKLGWECIILVMNEAYGSVELLPFDLRGRKVLTYSISTDAEKKSEERKKVSSILENGIKTILDLLGKKTKIAEKPKPVKANSSDEILLTQEAKAKLGAIKSITYISQKNKAAIEAAEKYLRLKRKDLAVNFALIITYIRQKNDFLMRIAEECLDERDAATADKAIKGITYIRQRNELSMKLLEMLK